jgi:hypothetical protein
VLLLLLLLLLFVIAYGFVRGKTSCCQLYAVFQLLALLLTLELNVFPYTVCSESGCALIKVVVSDVEEK